MQTTYLNVYHVDIVALSPIGLVAGGSAVVVVGLIAAGICWYRYYFNTACGMTKNNTVGHVK
jgi:hypothetical protein